MPCCLSLAYGYADFCTVCVCLLRPPNAHALVCVSPCVWRVRRVQVYGVSWTGQILCCYDIVTGPSFTPRAGRRRSVEQLGQGATEPEGRRFGGAGASSMSFNDTLQVTGPDSWLW